MGSVPGSAKVTRCTSKPAPLSTFSITASAPPSAGVTDGQRMRSRARAIGSAMSSFFAHDLVRKPVPTFRDHALVAQQLVDAGLGARLFVHALHDHGAVEARTGLPILHRFAGQRAWHHHGIGGHFTHEDLAGLAI